MDASMYCRKTFSRQGKPEKARSAGDDILPARWQKKNGSPKAPVFLFVFARHGGQTQPAERRRHPDQGEDNPNRR